MTYGHISRQDICFLSTELLTSLKHPSVIYLHQNSGYWYRNLDVWRRQLQVEPSRAHHTSPPQTQYDKTLVHVSRSPDVKKSLIAMLSATTIIEKVNKNGRSRSSGGADGQSSTSQWPNHDEVFETLLALSEDPLPTFKINPQVIFDWAPACSGPSSVGEMLTTVMAEENQVCSKNRMSCLLT